MFKHYRTDPLTEREKAHIRRSKGIMKPFTASTGPKPADKPKERTFIVEMKADWRPKKKGHGCRMSPEVRAMVEARKKAREEFFAALGRRV